ncbi:FAD binding domain-containing protein [Halogeometricum limi]|uniref:Carbon-monoxide dehydrogenase medium subunit n=1 Tax=Halogeometricum limi TaxID=555875 RepID=A0A1I6IDA8_9EURY|nr:FAD binding domain-containing protein [Halogeometricum limi]SFR64340.1 carbon-monoxide dehydrogenase medium subunit [Halogeometricum limi]
MKPAAFDYHTPADLDDVFDLFESYPEAELVAGNQSLGIVMANRLATPEHLIDLGGVDELRGIDVADDVARVGAMTTHRDLERSAALKETIPMLPDAARQIAGPSVRSRGTLGGSLAEADPAGNYPAALVALDGTLHLRSRDDARDVSAEEFFVAYMFTDLREDELIESVTVSRDPFPTDRTGMAFEELKRAAQTFPTVSAAAVVRVDDPDASEPVVEHARVALANAADVPLLVGGVSEAVEGEPLTDETVAEAADVAEAAADPAGELHADTEFKTEVAAEYTRIALTNAHERAIET